MSFKCNFNGLPVGISNLEIMLLSKLNKYLQSALIEFPCAEIKTLFFKSFDITLLKYGITLSYVSLRDSVSGIRSFD